MRKKELAVVAVFATSLLCVPSLLGERVTVVTKKGETVEGTFLGCSATECSVEVAGHPLQVPLSVLQYISTGGALNPAPDQNRPPVATLEGALAALASVETAVKIGVLRQQYSDKLQMTLPMVLAFLEAEATNDQWGDVKDLIRFAVAFYQEPLRNLSAWRGASFYFARAADAVGLARALSKDAGERSHKETPTEQKVQSSDDIAGRLGRGDQTVPASLDKEWAGRFADVYLIEAAPEELGELVVTARGTPCALRAFLVDAAGARLADSRSDNDLTFRRWLRVPGAYRLWLASQAGPCLYEGKLVIER